MIVLDDPYEDPKGLEVPDMSPIPPKHLWGDLLDEEEFDKIGKIDDRPQEEIDEELAAKEAKSREHLLEIVGSSLSHIFCIYVIIYIIIRAEQ